MLRKTTQVLLISLLILLSTSQPGTISAGINVWTGNGPEGGSISALVIDPATPTTLYAGTEGGGVFKSTNGGGDWSAVNTGFRPSFTCDGVSEISRTECEALVSFYDGTAGPGWTNQDGWLVTNTPCSWYGVTCEAGHVQKLELVGIRLRGTISPELGNLTSLQRLDLHSDGFYYPPFLWANQLSGWIPHQLGNLLNLQELDLSCNYLSGVIPPDLGHLANLKVLNLANNELSGAIPPELIDLANLQMLTLSRNQLSGAIPIELGNLPSLQGLDLSYNQLSGAIPPELGNLDSLQTLSLSDNQLSGAIPLELGNLPSLQGLHLSFNRLSGAIPPELGSLTNLQGLDLYGNQLSGTIPRELGSLASLGALTLGGNQLSGAIPPELGNLAKLSWLFLDGNQLSGAIPSELGNLASLGLLGLSHNQLSGAIPPELGQLAQLDRLYLNQNQLSGAIPSELGNLASLWRLDLSSNRLSGAIPPELGNLFSLQGLDLSNNQLSGALPHSLTKISLWDLFFDNTNLCEPPDAAFQTWLASISNLRRTGVICSIVTAPANVAINGSTTGMANRNYAFTASAEPISTTIPVTYVWEATGQSPVTAKAGLTSTVTFNWTTAGEKVITVTAENAGGAVSATHVIAIEEPYRIYLPLVLRPSVDDDLLVWYDFEGDFLTSGIIADRSGNGHDAQVNGTVDVTAGISGSQAIFFSGNGYIQASGNPAAGRTNVTFSLWFKTEHPENNYKLASGAWWNWGPGSGWIMATHVPEFWGDDGQGLVLPGQPNNDNQFAAGEWVHEVVTYDGDRIREYTNGQLVNDWPTTGATIGQGRPMVVGAWPPFSAYNFQGSIDEFRIYDRSLTQQEVQALYNQGR